MTRQVFKRESEKAKFDLLLIEVKEG